MIKHSMIWSLLATGSLLALLITAALPSVQDGYAQDSFTPTPSSTTADDDYAYDDPARVENGEAEWTLNSTEFINNYPDGFVFVGNVSSTGGELVSVSAIFSSVGNPDYGIRQRGEVNPETGTVRVEVSGRDADDIPPWVPINYQWRVSDESGTVYFSEWILGAEYADNTRNWTRLETDDALVYIQEGLPSDIADEMFIRLEQKRDQYLEFFGEPLSYAPVVVLFDDQAAFDEWRRDDVNRGNVITVGLAQPTRGVILQFLFQGNATDLANTVVHEVAHLYQFEAYQSRVPVWWREGEATYFEFQNVGFYEDRVRSFGFTNQLPIMFNETNQLALDAVGPDGRGRWTYDVGYTFYKYMVETYGSDTILEFYRLLDEPDDLPGFEIFEHFVTSLETATGDSVEEIESNWRVWMGASPEIPTLLPTPTLNFEARPTVTPFGQ